MNFKLYNEDCSRHMNFKLYNEDCLTAMARLPDKSVDMILADLPYGTTDCKWDSIIPLPELWKHYKRVCKGAIVLTAAQPFTSVLVCSNLNMFKYCWIWEKQQGTGFGNAKKQPLRNYEDICVFYDSQPLYNPQFEKGKPYIATSKSKARVYESGGLNPITTVNEGLRYPKQVIKFNWDKEKHHPTQKPVALMEYLIRTYTNEGDTVLDNTMGSGTTGVACMNTGRNFIGMEKDTEHGYFAIAEKRITDAAVNQY